MDVVSTGSVDSAANELRQTLVGAEAGIEQAKGGMEGTGQNSITLFLAFPLLCQIQVVQQLVD